MTPLVTAECAEIPICGTRVLHIRLVLAGMVVTPLAMSKPAQGGCVQFGFEQAYGQLERGAKCNERREQPRLP